MNASLVNRLCARVDELKIDLLYPMRALKTHDVAEAQREARAERFVAAALDVPGVPAAAQTYLHAALGDLRLNRASDTSAENPWHDEIERVARSFDLRAFVKNATAPAS